MVSDDYLGEIEQFLGAYREDCDDELIANPIAYHWLTVGALRAAAAELKQLRAQCEPLGAGEVQQRIVTPGGLSHSPSERDLAMRDDWLPGVRLEQRTVYGTPWEPAEDPPWTDHGDGWKSRRPTLSDFQGPFTGLLGPFGVDDAGEPA